VVANPRRKLGELEDTARNIVLEGPPSGPPSFVEDSGECQPSGSSPETFLQSSPSCPPLQVHLRGGGLGGPPAERVAAGDTGRGRRRLPPPHTRPPHHAVVCMGHQPPPLPHRWPSPDRGSRSEGPSPHRKHVNCRTPWSSLNTNTGWETYCSNSRSRACPIPPPPP